MRCFAILSIVAFVSSTAYAQQPAETQTQTDPDADQPAAPPPPAHIALRIVGSQVRNPSGDKLGRIEEVLVNRNTRAIDYAVLAPNFPTNESRLVPVPWSILNYAWDQSRAGGPAGANQIFIANLEPTTLAKAPTLDRTRTTDIDPALAAANSYFVPGVGSSGTGSGTITGGGSSQPGLVGTTAPGVAQDPNTGLSGQGQPFFVPSSGFPFVVTPIPTNGVPIPTNGVPVPTNGIPIPTNGIPIPTNGVPLPTNGVGTPIPGTNIGPFPPGVASPFTPFTGGTNSQVPRADPGPNPGQGTGSGAAPLGGLPPLQPPATPPTPPNTVQPPPAPPPPPPAAPARPFTPRSVAPAAPAPRSP